MCEPSFWDDGEWRGYGRALGIPQDEGWYHRKAREWTQCVYGLERLNALGRNKVVLGVGTGHERVLYYMANRSAVTVATDLYSGDFSDSPAKEADPAFLKDPAQFAPFVYDTTPVVGVASGRLPPALSERVVRRRLLAQLDRAFWWPRGGQPGHAGDEPGALARRYRLRGHRARTGRWPSPGVLHARAPEQYVVGPAGMSLVEPLADSRPSQELLNDPVILPEDYQKTPHIVMQEGPWKFTSVCLFMRKPTRVDRIANWLRRESM